MNARHPACCPLVRPGIVAHPISFRIVRGLLVALAATLALPGSLLAATLRGQVTDPDGRPVPGVEVVLSTPVSVARTATTDTQGDYRFDALGAGRYDLRFVFPGFAGDPRSLTLAAGDDREVAVQLRVAAVSESIVVSAAQVEVPLSRVGDSVTVLTAKDLQSRQFETVADALRLVPGLTISENGGRGSVTSVLPRGGDSDYTLVLINGMKANAFGGGFDFSQLAMADIDRIEIVRGPQSALHGSDAIGAVVQILTRQGGPPRADGLVETGSLGSTRLAAGASGSRGAWSFGGGAEHLATNGFKGIAPATGERVTNDDWRSTHASASLGWQRPGGLDVRGDALITSTDRGYPGPFGSNPIGAYTGVDRISRGQTTTRQLGLGLRSPWLAGHRVRQDLQATFLDVSSDFTSAYGFSASATRRLTARSQTDLSVNAATALSAGIELQRERATSTFITGGSSAPLPIHRLVIGLFAEARYQPNERLSVAAGARVEYFKRDRLDGNVDPYSPRPPFGVETMASLNPKVSASYLVREPRGSAGGGSRLSWTRIRGGAGTGIRPPDAFEIAFTDNPALRPERSRSAEVGVEQAFGGDAVRLDATAFVNRYDDLIVAVGPAMGDISHYRTDNIANASARGLEIAGAARVARGLDVRLTYTLLDTQVLAVDGSGTLAQPPFKVGQPLLRRPRHQGSLDLVYTRGRVVAYANVGGRGRVLDVEPSYGTYGGLFTTAGYTVANAGVSVRILRAIDIVARVTNLLGRTYEQTLGFPALGRAAVVGIRIAARR